MEATLSLLVGAFFAAAIYLLLSTSLVRIVLGVVVLGNAVNLLLFTAGRLVREVPPIIGPGASTLEKSAANPLPQALILTAIVISFSFFAFLLVLVFRTYQALGTDRTTGMHEAEPAGLPETPEGY